MSENTDDPMFADAPAFETEPARPRVEISRKGTVVIDGRVADLPTALRQIGEELARVAGDILGCDRLSCEINIVQSARSYTQFKIECWRSQP